MKNWITIFVLSLVLVGCGMSETEKQQVAAVTCSVMGESRNIDSYLRIKEINAARVELGEEPFLGGDEMIKESFQYGLCEELVKNDPDYGEKLAATKQLEREFIAEQKGLVAEMKRLQKRQEKERYEAERKAKERERIPQQNWRKAIVKDIGNYSSRITEVEFISENERLEINFECKKIKGYQSQLFYVLKNGLGTLKDWSSVFREYRGTCKSTFYPSTGLIDDVLDAFSATQDPKSLIESAYFEITGVSSLSPSNRNRELSSTNFRPLGSRATLTKPIRIEVDLN